MRNPFRSPSLALGFAVAGIFQPVRAEVLGIDPIMTGTVPAAGEYAVAAVAGQNPLIAGFTGAWVNPGVSATTTGLIYTAPDYLAASGGALEHTAANRPYRAMDGALLAAFAGEGTVYWSFLAKFGTTGDNSAWGGYAAVEVGTNGGNDNGKALAIGIDGGGVAGNFMYQINNGTKTSLGTASDTNTHLFLVRFDLSATAASDAVKMWIDPDLSGGLVSDPSGGVTVSGLDLFSITNFRFGAGGANSFADELRFGTTLESVIAGPEQPPAPAFVTHPTDYFGFVDDTVTLSASASADPAPGYQWEYSENGEEPWAPVSGATAAVLQIPAAPYSANGSYRAVATNTNGSATSNPAIVSLSFPPPTINRQPVSVYAVAGSTAALSVEATGIGTLSYKWFKDSSELVGQTSATLTFGALDSEDAGEYFVEITDHAAEGSGEAVTWVTSATVIVGILDSPELAYEPVLMGADPLSGEYTAGAVPGQNPDVGGFSGAWAGDSSVSASAPGLSYLNYEQGGGAFAHTAAGRPYRLLDAPTTSVFAGEGAVYWSFLAKFSTPGDNSAWGGYAAVEVGTNGSNDNGKALAIGIDGGALAGSFMYQINNGSKVNLATASDSDTHLFLVRFDLSAAAASDGVTMWIDPDLSGGHASDPSGGTVVTGLDLFSITNFRFGAGGANSFADEVRFGTTLESVIPAQLASQTFESWIAQYPSVGTQDGFDDDPDGDGLDNGIESVLGTDPSASNSGVVNVALTGGTLSFQHPQNPNPPSNVTAAYRWSSDLATWNASGATSGGTTVTFAPSPNTPVAGTTTVTATVTGTPATKLFVVIEASSP